MLSPGLAVLVMLMACWWCDASAWSSAHTRGVASALSALRWNNITVTVVGSSLPSRRYHLSSLLKSLSRIPIVASLRFGSEIMTETRRSVVIADCRSEVPDLGGYFHRPDSILMLGQCVEGIETLLKAIDVPQTFIVSSWSDLIEGNLTRVMTVRDEPEILK